MLKIPWRGQLQKSRRQPPHLNRVVKTAADQSFVLRIKSQFHPGRMTLQRARHFTGIHLPQLDSPAQIGAGKLVSVGTESQRLNLVGMADQSPQQRTVGLPGQIIWADIPQLHRLVPTATGESLTVRADG